MYLKNSKNEYTLDILSLTNIHPSVGEGEHDSITRKDIKGNLVFKLFFFYNLAD